jgi:transcriptional regulator with XRE-family HTH domain
MKLQAWLTKEKITAAEFARISGVKHRQLIWKFARGEQFPSPDNLIRISEATKGEVTAMDFLADRTARRPTPEQAVA